jgi:TonB family protein
MITGVQAQGVEQNNNVPAAPIRFELPAQPLATALLAYGSLTSMLVGVKGSLLDGHTSAPLHGDYSPREALQLLLAGTGLEATFPNVDEAIIVPQSQGQQAATPAMSSIADDSAIDGTQGGSDYRAYASMIQMRLTEALCKSPLTHPGSYRLVTQLRIDDTGSVVASKLVDSTGLPARDAAIERAVRTLRFDAPPPAGLTQPVTILVRPQSDGVDTDCAQFTEAD